MQKIFRLLQYANMLSLDIAAGAVICCAFFARIFTVTLLPYGYIALGLAVWIIYTADHLLDVWKNPHPASTERHRFHQQHFTTLSILLALAMVVVGIEVNFIRLNVLIGGIQLSILVAIYFIVQRQLKFLKELAAALLYTGGVLIAPVALLSFALNPMQITLVVQFFLTALANLLLFSLFDLKNDSKDRHPSFVISLGESTSIIFLYAIFIVNAGITLIQYLALHGEAVPAFVILFMNIMLVWILLNRKYFGISDRYRIMGDAVFLLPAMYILAA
jgi:hypothetical protein